MSNLSFFADRILNVAVTGPLVRIELGSLAQPVGQNDNPQYQSTQTLVLPLDGFVASLGMMEAVAKRLIADGVLKPQPAAQVPATPTHQQAGNDM